MLMLLRAPSRVAKSMKKSRSVTLFMDAIKGLLDPMNPYLKNWRSIQVLVHIRMALYADGTSWAIRGKRVYTNLSHFII